LKDHTDAPFLVDGDSFLKVDDKEQVWDTNTGSARPFDADGVDPALEGEFTVAGSKVKPGYQLFKEHMLDYTPEMAAEITGLTADQIRNVAEELGKNAMIGSTVVIDGVEVPYRPVGLMGYHVSQQELGFQSFRGSLLVFMLLGAIESVGGVRVDFGRKVDKRYASTNAVTIGDPPYNLYLDKSKFYPIVAAQAMLDPEKYGIDVVPEVLLIHMANPLVSFPGSDLIYESYMKLKFVAVVDPWLSETADYFADIVLPAATMEKYEGPLNATDQYEDATAMRIPPVDPLYQTRGDVQIYLDLTEKMGTLYGDDGFIDRLNGELKIADEYKLDVNTKPTEREIFDRWSKSQGLADGIKYFEEKGVWLKGDVPADKLYAPAWSPPYGGIRHRLYGDALVRYQKIMKEKGADEIYYRDYTAFPTWRPLTINKSPPEYDLTLISFKHIEYKQSRSSFNPLLHELEPIQSVRINADTAASKGLKDGDEVTVESQNAVTGETKTVKTKVMTTELIRPDTVAMAHHFGMWVHPVMKEAGPTPNSLFFTGEGYVTNTADQTFHVNVKVTKEA
jgi:anaerobic selenocysteine-containing dehydrogenase